MSAANASSLAPAGSMEGASSTSDGDGLGSSALTGVSLTVAAVVVAICTIVYVMAVVVVFRGYKHRDRDLSGEDDANQEHSYSSRTVSQSELFSSDDTTNSTSMEDVQFA